MIYKIIYSVILLISSGLLFSEEGYIVDSSGEVSIKRLNSNIEATAGQNLNSGDVISTGSSGTVLLILADGTEIDIYNNSRFILPTLGENSQNNIVSKLWNSVKTKFTDVEYSSAQSGRVGAIRSTNEDENIYDDFISYNKKNEMNEFITSLENENFNSKLELQLKAVVFEENGQYKSAEKIYLELINLVPNEVFYYDMLIDLYLKIDLYNHVKYLVDLKKERGFL